MLTLFVDRFEVAAMIIISLYQLSLQALVIMCHELLLNCCHYKCFVVLVNLSWVVVLFFKACCFTCNSHESDWCLVHIWWCGQLLDLFLLTVFCFDSLLFGGTSFKASNWCCLTFLHFFCLELPRFCSIDLFVFTCQ